MVSMGFQNKVAVVSGGSQGIGLTIARRLVEAGAKVIIGDVNRETGAQAAQSLGEACAYIHLDVTKEDDWRHLYTQTIETFNKVDILVNNAGVTGSASDIEHETVEDWQMVHNVNVLGVFLGVKYAMKNMTQGGAIVNINSLGGIFAEAAAVAYSASKGAGRMITKSAALYGAQKSPVVRVNSVHPGATNTAMIAEITRLQPEIMAAQLQKVPLKRIAEPEDIANMVLYLASDLACYITGGEFLVDGGMSAGF